MKKITLLAFLMFTAPIAQATELTSEDFINLMSQNTGTFKVPLSVNVFKSIRNLSNEDAQAVINHFTDKRLETLNATKTNLTDQLSKIEAQIQVEEAKSRG